MNTKLLRMRLIDKGLLLKDLSRETRIDYDRLQKVVHGYRRPRTDEVAAIATAIGVPPSDLCAGPFADALQG